MRGPAGARSASCVTMAGSLKEEDFVPSERWLGEYMGQQGLRYALNKTPDEIKKEGEYRGSSPCGHIPAPLGTP